MNLKKEKSGRLKVKFKKADNKGVTEKGKKEVVSANNKFALNLYSYLSTSNPDKNIFFSPYSIFTAMAMTYEGSNGQTANEIQSVFYFPENKNVLRSALANIYNQLNKPKTEYQFLTANALWIQGNLQSKIFKEIQKYYGAKIFIKTSAEKINQWIEYKTMNKFKNVVKDCNFCGLSLINTIYFKGNWNQKFEKSNTKKRPFIISEKEKMEVPMMNMTETFNYMETEAVQVLEMPYKGEELSMLVLLAKDFPGNPKKKNMTNTTKNLEKADLTSLEEALTEKNLKEWRKALFKQKVRVYIPKFTFKKDYELSKTLKQYMPLAFDREKADFSKFAETIKRGKQNLYIEDIIHKSFIEVNEEGTEAAAVTVVTVGFGSSTGSISVPPVFKVDHPFIFLIQERETGQILFIGKVIKPKV